MKATYSQCRIFGLGMLIVLLFVANAVNASVDSHSRPENSRTAPNRSMSIGQALDVLSQELHAHIVIMGKLGNERIFLDLEKRSAMDNLKSILKGYSYALIFNIPPYSYSAIIETASGELIVVSNTASGSIAAVQNEKETGKVSIISSGAQDRRPNDTTVGEIPDNIDAIPNDHDFIAGRTICRPRQETYENDSVRQGASLDRRQDIMGSLRHDQQPIVLSDDQSSLDGLEDNLDPIQRFENANAQQSSSITMREALLAQIRAIQAQIDRGEAERMYNDWSQVRDPRYVYNHHEKLDYYQKKLEALDY